MSEAGAGPCPRCGTDLRANARFCDQCGAPLADTPLASSDAVPSAAFAQSLLPPGFAPESERKQITVLFGDISGSTRLISGRDPERAWALLNPVLEVMMEAVRTYGGTVNQIQGDGIMALIGAPLALEDHALRACYAALRMQKEIARAFGAGAPAENPADPPLPIRVHVGIATGAALVGTIGSGLTLVYNAAGEVIHVAARLQRLAAPGQTFCTAETLRQAGELVRGTSRGMTEIRGVGAPVELIELVGVASTPRHFRPHGGADGSAVPMQGRTREFAAICERLERARGGESQLLALVGDAGLGKSRLVWELTHAPLIDGWQVLEAGCISFGVNTPYHPIAGLLRELFGIAESDDVATIRAKLAERLGEIIGTSDEMRTVALAVLGLDPEDRVWTEMQPQQRRDAIRSSIVNLLLRLARDRPLLLVVEDLHWIDDESHALLSALLDRMEGKLRLLLLVDYRPAYDPGWSDRPNASSISLAPLPRAEAMRLAEALFANAQAYAALGETLIERTGGNPFFMQETVRALADAGVLQGSPGAWRLAGEWSGGLVASSVRAVLQARIDRLPAGEKRLLQTVAVVGERFALMLLRRFLSEVPPEVLNAQLHHLQTAGLINEVSLFPEPRYAFAHALIQEVAYEGLLQARRRQMHAALVPAIESTYAERLSEHFETLAFHAARGEVWESLAIYALEAGRRAASQSAYREAARYFEQAILAFRHLPDSPARNEAAIETRFELRNALFPLGEIARDLESLREAESVAVGTRHHPWIVAYIARDLALLGHPDEALEVSRRALRLAGPSAKENLRVLVRSYVGQAHYALGDFHAAASLMSDLLREIGGRDASATYGLPFAARTTFRCWLAWALARLGRSDELLALEEILLNEDAASEHPLGATVAQYSAGFAALGRDEFEMAISRLEEAARRCKRWDFRGWFCNIASSLGHALAEVGRVDEGLDYLWQAVRQSRALRLMVSHSLEVAWLAEATLAAGRVQEAREHAAEAVQLARDYHERGNEAYALWVAGSVARRGGEAESDAFLDNALKLALECDMKPLAARCRQALARTEVGSR